MAVDYFDLNQTLMATLEQAYADVDSMREAGIGKAKARAAYRAALKTRILALRADKAIPAGLIPKVAEGCADVNQAFVEAEVAEAEYDAAKETVMLRKREADILREQLSREWSIPRKDGI